MTEQLVDCPFCARPIKYGVGTCPLCGLDVPWEEDVRVVPSASKPPLPPPEPSPADVIVVAETPQYSARAKIDSVAAEGQAHEDALISGGILGMFFAPIVLVYGIAEWMHPTDRVVQMRGRGHVRGVLFAMAFLMILGACLFLLALLRPGR